MTPLSQAFEAQGEIKGLRDALRRVLHMRFGSIPETVEQRIGVADSRELDDLIDRAVTVERIEAL